jgi:hypothetical protein
VNVGVKRTRNSFGSIALTGRRNEPEEIMPIILWLLGVPISLILVLMLFGVF